MAGRIRKILDPKGKLKSDNAFSTTVLDRWDPERYGPAPGNRTIANWVKKEGAARADDLFVRWLSREFDVPTDWIRYGEGPDHAIGRRQEDLFEDPEVLRRRLPFLFHLRDDVRLHFLRVFPRWARTLPEEDRPKDLDEDVFLWGTLYAAILGPALRLRLSEGLLAASIEQRDTPESRRAAQYWFHLVMAIDAILPAEGEGRLPLPAESPELADERETDWYVEEQMGSASEDAIDARSREFEDQMRSAEDEFWRQKLLEHGPPFVELAKSTKEAVDEVVLRLQGRGGNGAAEELRGLIDRWTEIASEELRELGVSSAWIEQTMLDRCAAIWALKNSLLSWERSTRLTSHARQQEHLTAAGEVYVDPPEGLGAIGQKIDHIVGEVGEHDE